MFGRLAASSCAVYNVACSCTIAVQRAMAVHCAAYIGVLVREETTDCGRVGNDMDWEWEERERKGKRKKNTIVCFNRPAGLLLAKHSAIKLVYEWPAARCAVRHN